MDAKEVMRALVQNRYTSPFYWGRNFVCLPHSNSFTSWEADLLVCSKSGFLTEVEIKVARQDWRNDRKKRKFQPALGGGRRYGWGFIKQFYYAAPMDLAMQHAELGTPSWAGVYGIANVNDRLKAVLVKPAEVLEGHRKLNDKQLLRLARLGAVRMWT